MLDVRCHGTPYQVGQQHGRAARAQVKGSIAFYQAFFLKKTKMEWPEVTKVAAEFIPLLVHDWPQYLEEMNGIADGAGVDLASILALNVRTEIAYGMMSDGCTAFSWKTKDASFIAQNWDWENDQSPNIIRLHIEQHHRPTIHMMTEAGIIGKIGLNSAGVGVTLNAIAAQGVNFQRLPTHLALRTVLDSSSRQDAYDKLKRAGIASACHITIADFATGGIGLENSASDTVELPMNAAGICTHTNNFTRPHVDESKVLLTDSPVRLERINSLLATSGSKPSMELLTGLLKDQQNYPTSICRAPTEKSRLETLFSIVMDLDQRYARVKMGQPTEDGEEFELRP